MGCIHLLIKGIYWGYKPTDPFTFDPNFRNGASKWFISPHLEVDEKNPTSWENRDPRRTVFRGNTYHGSDRVRPQVLGVIRLLICRFMAYEAGGSS